MELSFPLDINIAIGSRGSRVLVFRIIEFNTNNLKLELRARLLHNLWRFIIE